MVVSTKNMDTCPLKQNISLGPAGRRIQESDILQVNVAEEFARIRTLRQGFHTSVVSTDFLFNDIAEPGT